MANPYTSIREMLRFLFGAKGRGLTFYVDSNNGNAAYGGASPDAALVTIDAAVELCTANRGDKIIVMPGHAETISGAAGINCDVAGITIEGLGKGAYRPTITMSATTSTVAIGAASVTLKNLLFKTTAAVVIVVDVNSTDAVLEDLEFRNTTTNVATTCIDINGGGANACDRTKIVNCVVDMGASDCARAIELGEVANGVSIKGCTVFGAFTDACIHNPTGKVLTNLYIGENLLTNNKTGQHSIELVSACTGNLARNLYHNDMTQATGVDPGSCFSFECYHDDVIDTSAIIAPAVT